MTLKYAYNPKREDKAVKAYGRGLRISTKSSIMICRKISGLTLKKAKRLLERLLTETQSIDGKYYTNSASEILELLKSAEGNAEFKGLDQSRIFVKASAHEGFTFWRNRRFKMKRMQRKVSNIQIVLEER